MWERIKFWFWTINGGIAAVAVVALLVAWIRPDRVGAVGMASPIIFILGMLAGGALAIAWDEERWGERSLAAIQRLHLALRSKLCASCRNPLLRNLTPAERRGRYLDFSQAKEGD